MLSSYLFAKFNHVECTKFVPSKVVKFNGASEIVEEQYHRIVLWLYLIPKAIHQRMYFRELSTLKNRFSFKTEALLLEHSTTSDIRCNDMKYNFLSN